MTVFVSMALACCIGAGVSDGSDNTDQEVRALAGLWQSVDDKSDPKQTLFIGFIRNAKDRKQLGDHKHAIVIESVDTSRRPYKKIDGVIITIGSLGPINGIYELKKDTLKICYEHGPGLPGKLNQIPGKRSLLTLKRVKKR